MTDKFPKIETIEATLFGDRMDRDSIERASTLSKALLVEGSEFKRLNLACLHTVLEIAPLGALALEICLSVLLTTMLQVGVEAERARAECEQLQDAMNPRQLTEGSEKPCHRDSCDTIT